MSIFLHVINIKVTKIIYICIYYTHPVFLLPLLLLSLQNLVGVLHIQHISVQTDHISHAQESLLVSGCHIIEQHRLKLNLSKSSTAAFFSRPKLVQHFTKT